MRKTILSMALLAALPLVAQQSARENIDLDVLNQIKAEAFQNSQALEDVFYLSDQPSAVELARKIGLSAFYFDAKSAPSITSFLRVNM